MQSRHVNGLHPLHRPSVLRWAALRTWRPRSSRRVRGASTTDTSRTSGRAAWCSTRCCLARWGGLLVRIDSGFSGERGAGQSRWQMWFVSCKYGPPWYPFQLSYLSVRSIDRIKNSAGEILHLHVRHICVMCVIIICTSRFGLDDMDAALRLVIVSTKKTWPGEIA